MRVAKAKSRLRGQQPKFDPRQEAHTTLKIVGFAAGPDQIKDLRAGTVHALIAQQPGNSAVASPGRRAGHAPKVQTGPTIITEDNVDTTAADAAYQSSC